ncbi:cysteine hydrolase family protein [Mesorhizobium sp. ES1-1]|uniref:cysteine hydrolase family protein n=1 Tax=Mesorhizobium sp. ES1-1 TaxID=2876629 RepID=UPI001CCDCF0C|nr:isochorismatase family cysteine hydrolase [Mesorhizobium sp. ES1-1]MBZ9675424.1 cysteine hydrolase [Mesorhizobium sp. ES1-1]
MIKATPFDFPYDGRLVAENTALVVIDLQEDFLSTSGYFARQGYDPSRLRAILPTVNRVISASRAAGLRIVHTRQGYRADMADMTPYEKWRRKRAGLEGTDVLLRSSPGFEIVPEIDVAAHDIIVDKTCNSAFTYTDFEHVLRAQGITHLLFSGCTTDVCVHTTLREACDRNFQCLTISDACASGDAKAHEAALHMVTVENGIFGALADSDAVIAGLSILSGEAHRHAVA